MGIYWFPSAKERGSIRAMEGRNPWTDSEETGEPFSHCMRCKEVLGAEKEPWLINKEYRNGECVLEFAICQPCRLAVTNQLSSHSRETVRDFVEKEIEPGEEVAKPGCAEDLSGRFDACVSCGRKREELSCFGISALFDRRGPILAGPLPLLICQDCTAKMTSNISSHSRDVWGKFLGDHLEGPPDGSGFHGLI